MQIVIHHDNSTVDLTIYERSSIRSGDVIAFRMSHHESWEFLKKGRIQKLPYDLFQYGHLAMVVPSAGALWIHRSVFYKAAEVASRIAGKASCHLRLAAPAMLIREHLPKVLVALRKSNPQMELSLMEAGQLRTLELLELEEIDLTIAELENNAPPGIQCEILAALPMVLLIPEGVKIPKGGIHDLVDHYPLIRPPANTAVSRLFSKGLERTGLK